MQWPEATAGVTGEAADSGLLISALPVASELPSGLDLPCTDDPDLFFAEAPADLEQAKALCQGCRARIGCLQGALERREHWGVWGGELLVNGTIVPRKRPRGRPRKTDPATAGSLDRRPRQRWARERPFRQPGGVDILQRRPAARVGERSRCQC